MTTTETEATNPDIEALVPAEDDPIYLVDGTPVRVTRLRTRETLALLKILAKGAGDVLAETRFRADMDTSEFMGVFAGSVLLSVPEAEDETIEFVRRMVLPIDYNDDPRTKADETQNREKMFELYRKLHNPDLDDLITIVERIVVVEGPHLVALGKRLAALLVKSPLTPKTEKPSTRRKSSKASSSESTED